MSVAREVTFQTIEEEDDHPTSLLVPMLREPQEREGKGQQEEDDNGGKSSHVWTVTMPPRTNSFKGSLKGKLKSKAKSQRLVRVETQGFGAQVRISAPVKRRKRLTRRLRRSTTTESDHGSDVAAEESCSLSTIGERGVEEDEDNDSNDADSLWTTSLPTGAGGGGGGWYEKYSYSLHSVTVKSRTGRVVVTTLVSDNNAASDREMTFVSESDAAVFCQVLSDCREKEEKKARDALSSVLQSGDNNNNNNTQFRLLIEIVSAWDLPAVDIISSSDPFVVLSCGNGNHHHRRRLHDTDVIKDNVAPVWTLTSKAFFLWTLDSPQDLFLNSDVRFEVRDHDSLKKGTSLGAAHFTPEELYVAKGERLERKLKPLPGCRDYGKGYLAIRCRHATDNDVAFLKSYEASKSSRPQHIAASSRHMILKPNTGLVPLPKATNVLRRNVHTDKQGVQRNRVRPYPDPTNTTNDKANEEWMTSERIEALATERSVKWIEAGSGKLGKLYLEILGCDDLPNMDKIVTPLGVALPSMSMTQNKTDPFVSVVYNDALLYTDLIEDTLSPRWMPWTRRAFVFNMMHVSSQINIGVFDYDTVGDHDLIGRVSVDVTNLREDTVYDLTYRLYTSAQFSNRNGGGDDDAVDGNTEVVNTTDKDNSRGRLRIRLRLAYNDPREMVLSPLRAAPPTVYVNVKSKKDFRVIRGTCNGQVDMERYSLNVIYSLLEELMNYLWIPKVYIGEGLLHLMLWRGTFDFEIKLVPLRSSVSVSFPLYSLMAFIAATSIIEKPELMPSYFFGSIVWTLLASKLFRRKDPSPWRSGCRTIRELTMMLLLGRSKKCVTIQPHENGAEAERHERTWQEYLNTEEERLRVEKEELDAEYYQELEETGDTDYNISSKSGSVSVLNKLNLMKTLLFPIQQWMAYYCNILRFTKHVILWEESVYAFWLCMISAVLTVVCFFVPWRFVTLWTCRIVAWALFGPWMKLIDIYFFRTLKHLSKEEQKAEREEAKKLRDFAKNLRVREARINRESATKLRQIKKYMFGKFTTKVPVLKLDRYRDVPLPESSAKPYNPEKVSLGAQAMLEGGKNCTKVGGQHLEGNMIPVQINDDGSSRIGKHIMHQSLLTRNSVGANINGGDSTVIEIVKVISVFGGVAVLTWYAVPILIEWARLSTDLLFQQTM